MPQPRTVLIVDDEDLFRTSVSDALGHACPHYKVMEAANGQEALQCLENHTTDIILTDLNMPVMNGIDLLFTLRERNFEGSVITVTAYGDPQLEQEVTQGGAFAHIEKPVDLDQLIQLVRETAEGYHSYIEGLTLQGFSQLIAMESKTCRLRVFQGAAYGDLYFSTGELVQAQLHGLSGEAAALQLLALEDDIRLELHNGIRPPEITISTPFNHLLMDAMRLRDESALTSSIPSALLPAIVPNQEIPMENVSASLEQAMSIDGAIGISLVDYESGMTLGQAGGGEQLDIDIASAGNTAVVRAKLRVMAELGFDDKIEDILISLGKQYHLIRPLTKEPNLFLYFALDRERANLGMARHRLSAIERNLAL